MFRFLQRFFLFCGLLSVAITGCTRDPVFKPIPTDLAAPVLSDPIFFLVNPATARGYLINGDHTVNYAEGSLWVLDLSNPVFPKPIAAAAIKHFSGQAVLDSSGQFLYLTNRLSSDSEDLEDQIFRINISEASPDFLKVDEFAADSNPFGIRSTGDTLWVVNEKSLNRYQVTDLSKRTRVELNVQKSDGNTLDSLGARELVVSPSGQFLFVSNRNDRLMVLDTSQIPLPDLALPLTLGGSEAIDYLLLNTFSTRGITSDGQWIYVVEGAPPTLKILSEASFPPVSGPAKEVLISNVAVAELPLAENPNGISVDPILHRAYVALTDSNEVAVIDTQLLSPITRVSVKDGLSAGIKSGEMPFAITAANFGANTYVYVLNLATDTISILDGTTLQVVGSFP